MEEVVADQAGKTRRPAKASRRRTGGRASPVASEAGNATAPPPPPVNLPHGGLAAEDEEEGDPDARYLNKEWSSSMAMSLLLVWVKFQAITHPPTWISSSARLAGGAARLYDSRIKISLILEVAIVVELCLFKLKVVSAARARITIRMCMVVGLVSSLVAAVAAMVGGSASEDWSGMAAVAVPSVALAVLVLFVLRKVNELRG